MSWELEDKNTRMELRKKKIKKAGTFIVLKCIYNATMVIKMKKRKMLDTLKIRKQKKIYSLNKYRMGI